MKNTGKEVPQKGHKRKYVREALEALGLDATKGQAAQWLEKKYGTTVGDPTFYDTRKQMQQQAGHRGPKDQAGQAPAPKAAAPAKAAKRPVKAPSAASKPTPVVATPQASARAEGPMPGNGVAALVTTAKGLVERLGKAEAKRLIDAL